MKTITLISTLPPVTCISDYTLGLVKSLSKHCKINFIGFKSPYPKFIFPGKVCDTSRSEPNIKNVEIKNILTWYNPFSWIYAGFFSKGDIIHAQWWSWPLAPIYLTIFSIAKFIRHKEIIITVHNVQPHEKGIIKKLINKAILFFGDKLIVHTENGKKELQKIFKKLIYVFPHGLIEISRKGYNQSSARTHLNIPKNKKVILFFGGIRDYKGLDTLLNAFARVIAEEKDAFLIIAGNLWESFSRYDKIIKKHNLSKFILKHTKFIPNSEVEYYFASSDLVALPYKRFEAQSGVGAVALNFEKPVVVTKIDGLVDLIKDKKVISEIDNPENLKEKIIYALKNIKKLEKDSKEKAKEFSWDEIAKATAEVYEK